MKMAGIRDEKRTSEIPSSPFTYSTGRNCSFIYLFLNLLLSCLAWSWINCFSGQNFYLPQNDLSQTFIWPGSALTITDRVSKSEVT